MKENLCTTLQNRADQCAKDAEFILSKTNDWQTIKKYLSNRLSENSLTETQQQKLERYQFIYNQLSCSKHSVQEVANQVIKLYNIKIAQAYEDINCAKEVLTSVINLNKLFELQLQLENNRHMLIKANTLNDMKAYAALEKNRVLLIKQIPMEDTCPGESFEGHTYELTFDPSLLGGPKIGKKEMLELLKMINEKRNKKINIDMFEELDFDEK